jgi:hypothetical protein
MICCAMRKISRFCCRIQFLLSVPPSCGVFFLGFKKKKKVKSSSVSNGVESIPNDLFGD